jgi:hypothetical protein
MSIVVTNLTKKVEGAPVLWTPSTLYSFHSTGKFYYDRHRLQRLLVEWSSDKKNSYLYTLINGASVKDCFQFAEIKPIVEFLKKELKSNSNDVDLDFIQENIDYFQLLIDNGFEYLVLDGKHRIDTIVSYFDDKHSFKPKDRIVFRKEGEQGTLSVSGKFSKMDEDLRHHIEHDIPLIVVIYKKGDLRELAHIFITSNSMMPMTDHEKRILNYNPLNRWLTTFLHDDVIVADMFGVRKNGVRKPTFKGMSSGDYSLNHKGDTLIVAEMLMYINNNKYEGYEHSVLDDVLGPYPKGIVKISKSEMEMTKKIMKIMAGGCAAYDRKKLKKFSKSTLYNLFYTISFILQKGNVWGKKHDIDGAYSIANKVEFVKWFFDEEHKRIFNPSCKMSFINPITGKKNSQMHDWSYAKHNADQKHSRKESVKGEGGSKYTFADWARVQYLLEDLNSNLNLLEKRSIITKLGDRNTLSRDESLVALNVPLSMSTNIEIDENLPVAKGGKREIGNIVALPKEQNRTKGKRTRVAA